MSTARSQVKLLIGDNDETKPVFTNDQIDTALELSSQDPFRAGAVLARNKAAEYGRKASVGVDSVRISFSERAGDMLRLASQLDAQAGSSSTTDALIAAPVVTGVSVSEIDVARGDTDRYQEAFYRGVSTP